MNTTTSPWRRLYELPPDAADGPYDQAVHVMDTVYGYFHPEPPLQADYWAYSTLRGYAWPAVRKELEVLNVELPTMGVEDVPVTLYSHASKRVIGTTIDRWLDVVQPGAADGTGGDKLVVEKWLQWQPPFEYEDQPGGVWEG